MKKTKIIKKLVLTTVLALTITLGSNSMVLAHGNHHNINFTDASGTKITIDHPPSRAVSLVPAVTDMIFKINADKALVGVTYHDTFPAKVSSKEVVGSFFNPSIEIIKELNPDVIFISDIHKEVRENFEGKAILIELDANSIDDIYKNINFIGKIFRKEAKAMLTIGYMQRDLGVIADKIAKIPESDRKRVIRLMGNETVMVPGDDSFQNDFIKSAGGIPPVFDKNGDVVTVTKEEWMDFNPQVIYACGQESAAAKMIKTEPGWKDVDAVKNGNILYFPCELTCRPSVYSNYFVSWLSANIYLNEFFQKDNLVLPEKVYKSKKLDLNLDYISKARVDYSNINDFPSKTLVIDLKKPMKIVSTTEGQRSEIRTVGNHYSSPMTWAHGHKVGIDVIRENIYSAIKQSPKNSSFLFTGADMDNLSIQKQTYKDLTVYALVTAGVDNAVRISKDEGRYYEPGTINIVILTNTKLSPRAMTKAIITATEAKTAVMQDYDIRSRQTSRPHQATGTGTDGVLVVEGIGTPITNTSSHSRVGELIGKAVYAGVKEALAMQNALTANRSIFRRIKERDLYLSDLIDESKHKDLNKQLVISEVEILLLNPTYASFLESAFSISDAHESGLIPNLEAFNLWCKEITEKISGKDVDKMIDLVDVEKLPVVQEKAFNAILNGVYLKKND